MTIMDMSLLRITSTRLCQVAGCLGIALLPVLLAGCAGQDVKPAPESTPQERLALAKNLTGYKNIPATLPPYPGKANQPKDAPGCKEDLVASNRKFNFSVETYQAIVMMKFKPWAFIRHDVNATGRLINARIIKSSGWKPYDNDALKSVKGWRIKMPPGKKSYTGCLTQFRIK